MPCPCLAAGQRQQDERRGDPDNDAAHRNGDVALVPVEIAEHRGADKGGAWRRRRQRTERAQARRTAKDENAKEKHRSIHADERSSEERHQRQIGEKLGAPRADNADEERERQRIAHHHPIEGRDLFLLEVVMTRGDVAEQNGDDRGEQRA